MQRLFFAFPAGLPGAGLLLLRVAAALMGLHESHVVLTAIAGIPSLLIALRIASLAAIASVLIGFATPVGCFILALEVGCASVLSLMSGVRVAAPELLLLNLGVMAVVIAAVGPGAFSLDARLFGRREVVFPD